MEFIINKNPADYENIYVIGDIHGNQKKLESLLSKITLSKNDLIVFLGDYIDRGKHSLKVIRTIWELEKNYNVVALCGNHEHMCIDYISKKGLENLNSYDLWICNGGKNTYKELAALRNKALQASYIRWIASRPLLLKLGDNIRIAHAGYNAFKYTLEERITAANGDMKLLKEELLWTRGDFLRYYSEKHTWYIGHTPTQLVSEELDEAEDSDKPIFLKNNIVMMDTGSYFPQGFISCINIKDNTIYQSDMKK